MRLALMQINTTVGDVTGNLGRILTGLEEARDQGAHLVLFPEMSLSGYPPEDLLFRPSFLKAVEEAENTVVQATRGLAAVFGYPYDAGGVLYNAASLAADGRRVHRIFKHHLPNYDVFDEMRYFSPGQDTAIFTWGRWTLGVSICEDIWYPDGPYLAQSRSGANLLINISASPFSRGKGRRREEMMATRADDAAAYLAYVNLVGAQDELVFDGFSAVFGPDGRVLARANGFQEDRLMVDLDDTPGRHRRWIDPRWRLRGVPEEISVKTLAIPLPEPDSSLAPVTATPVTPFMDDVEALYHALVTGVRDYIEKNRFGDVVIGLSGGIDSAVTAVIATDALGAGRVHGVFMPSAITSDESYRDAKELAERLGIEWRVIPIAPVMDAFMTQLAPHFAGRAPDLTEENLQARIRGTLLMALSNKMGWLVLTTGNKSEMATGYSTLYGDMAGGFAVLKDVLKTDVFRLARWMNRESVRIPENVLIKPPTAELRPGQKDEDSLPPYAILDQILMGYIENDWSVESLIRAGLDPDAVHLTVQLVNRNEYKRRQAPVGIKVTPRAFGRDRRMPITGRF